MRCVVIRMRCVVIKLFVLINLVFLGYNCRLVDAYASRVCSDCTKGVNVGDMMMGRSVTSSSARTITVQTSSGTNLVNGQILYAGRNFDNVY